MQPTLLQRVLAGLFAAASLFLIFIAFRTLPRGAARDFSGPMAFTIVLIIAYGALFGFFWILRNTDGCEYAATPLKVLLGATSVSLVLHGVFNLFGKDPVIPSRFLIADGCMFGILFFAFHLYTKRISNRQSA